MLRLTSTVTSLHWLVEKGMYKVHYPGRVVVEKSVGGTRETHLLMIGVYKYCCKSTSRKKGGEG
jgi:hypothetical protein